ncbi:MAG: hypothetical protein ACJ79C_01895 [Myxococcales bacterium]
MRRALLAWAAMSVLASAASGSPMQDPGWPRQIAKDGATFLYYQPQIDEWKDYTDLFARVAFSLTPAGGKPVLGVTSLRAGTIVDREARTVFLRDIELTDVRFPSLDPAAAKQMGALVRQIVPPGGETISLDRVLADLENVRTAAKPVHVNNDPPPIFFSTTPAILLLVPGEAVPAPIDKTNLEFIVNANWDVFRDKTSGQYFLLVEKFWLAAPALQGPWALPASLPADLGKLPAGQNFDDVKKMIPPPPPKGAPPKIFFSPAPAELIVAKGEPVYAHVKGTRLLFVSNTEADVFVDEAGTPYYLLLSGRWFRAPKLAGPWTFAGGDLPEDFRKIPRDSPAARVLASVPGTIEAADAVMLAQIPTSAIVNRAEAEKKVKVAYDGPPNFVAIPDTSMQYATNTQEKVIKAGDLYYLCFQAVWFVSASPTGPWKTADSIPKEIYTIPPGSPVYNVTYVYVTNPTPTTVQSSYAAGYVGVFVVGVGVGMTVAYGTGFYYPPYVYYPPGMMYPVYRPYPCTYGAAAVYNPYTGGYAVGRRAYGPYGAAGSSAWYNPATGRYGRSATVQSPYGGRTTASTYNPWTGTRASTSQGHNAYAQWGSTTAVRGNQWAQTGHVTTRNGTAAGYRTSSGQSGVAYRGSNGNVVKTDNGVYAGQDGNVYRKDSGGNWNQYDNGNWNQVDRPRGEQGNVPEARSGVGDAPRASQGAARDTESLDRSAQSRERGAAQTQQRQGGASGGRGGGRRR